MTMGLENEPEIFFNEASSLCNMFHCFSSDNEKDVYKDSSLHYMFHCYSSQNKTNVSKASSR